DELPTRSVVRAMGVLWGVVVLGGVVGMVLKGIQFASPVERLVPKSLLGIQFVHDVVHVSFSSSALSSRPQAPFTYTNQWGSALAILTPFAFATRRTLRS